MQEAPRASLRGLRLSGSETRCSEAPLQIHAEEALAKPHGDALVAVEAHPEALAQEADLRLRRLPLDADAAFAGTVAAGSRPGEQRGSRHVLTAAQAEADARQR